MLGARPESTEFAERLMHVSGGLAIAAGLFAWLTIPVTLYWVAVELTVGVLWFAATMALRTGRALARIAAAVLCVISIPLTGIMLILLSLFAATWPGVIVMLCDVIGLPLPVAIIVLLWTPGSRRYFRYVHEGGQVEPRPRRTLRRKSQEASPPHADGAVTAEDVRRLRDYLQADGQAEYPDSELAAAALAEAAVRRFGRRASRPQVADYVAEILARPGIPAQDVWPRAAKELLLAALRGRQARGIDPRVRRATSGVLLRALAPDGHANPAVGEEFVAAASSRADRRFR